MNTGQLSQKDFDILKELGSGSFGTVHLAQKHTDKKNYAIKSVQLAQMSQKEKDAALNEVRLLASISISYVIGYHGAYFDNPKQSLCIVMEFADGGDLQGKINELKDKTEEGFEETFVWKVAYEILNGLKILHKHKIIHRDIKSANIFFSKGIAKLGDLNVSKVAEHGMCETQTGTPYYTSPEIWKGEKYTSKCDIWSTGCLIYEMCTLTHPFRGRDFPSLYRKVIVGNYDPIPPRYSYDLRELIRMCLTVDYEMRPSASQLLETSVLSGMEANIDKFDSKGEIHLIDAIKCPRVLRFLNTKLPKPLVKDETKIVNFATKKEIEKTESQGFKMHRHKNLRKIRSQKVIPISISIAETGEEFTMAPHVSKIASRKQIKLPPLQNQQEESSLLKPPVNFSNKKLKLNSSMKKIGSRQYTNQSIKRIQRSSIEKDNSNNPSFISNTNGSRVLIPQSSIKKIVSNRYIQFQNGEKENSKRLIL